jgi:hypothetical protein
MSTDAIVLMIVAMIVIWGGLAVAIANLVRQGSVEGRAGDVRRDL